jgi:hypothetical protein
VTSPGVHESDDGNGGFCQTYLLVNTPLNQSRRRSVI